MLEQCFIVRDARFPLHKKRRHGEEKKNEKKSVRHPQPKPANNYAELLKLTVVHQFLGILELPLETKDTPHN